MALFTFEELAAFKNNDPKPEQINFVAYHVFRDGRYVRGNMTKKELSQFTVELTGSDDPTKEFEELPPGADWVPEPLCRRKLKDAGYVLEYMRDGILFREAMEAHEEKSRRLYLEFKEEVFKRLGMSTHPAKERMWSLALAAMGDRRNDLVEFCTLMQQVSNLVVFIEELTLQKCQDEPQKGE